MEFLVIVGLGLCVTVLIVALLAGLVGRVARGKRKLPYLSVDSLLSPAERSFYGVLKHAIGDQYEVMCKVRLMDLLWLPNDAPERQTHVNRIIAKHVDFVLCRPSDFSPQLVIELDDSTHQRRSRQERDAFVDAALSAAALNLLRVPARAHYSPHELRTLVIGNANPEDSRPRA